VWEEGEDQSSAPRNKRGGDQLRGCNDFWEGNIEKKRAEKGKFERKERDKPAACRIFRKRQEKKKGAREDGRKERS